MIIECDVLVVGGGPAGSSTSIETSKKGLKTIMIEEHKEIGDPVQCAEGIGKYLLDYMPIEVPKNQLKWKVEGMYFWADNIAIKKTGGMWEGYSVDRKEWDQWISSIAVKNGATLMKETKLKSFQVDKSGKVEKAIVLKNAQEIEIIPKYVIGADGVNSTVSDILFEKKEEKKGHVLSFEMKNLDLKYPNYDQLFFGKFAPRAYAYIFPISESSANLGIGTVFKNQDVNELFEEFLKINIVKKQVSNSKIVQEKTGDAPVWDLTKNIAQKNTFLVGDAANQNIKPFIEGNIPGIICGKILGEFLFELNDGNRKPEEYEKIVNEKFDLIQESKPYADLVYNDSKIESSTFNLLLLALMSEIIKPDQNEFNHYLSKGYDELKKIILQNGGFVEKNL